MISDWIEKKALPGRRISGMRELTGGYSNHNVVVTMDDGSAYVLRRYLRADKSAIEAALARRLAGVVPVPEVIAVGFAGEPVLLSRFVPGRMLSEVLMSADPGTAGELGSVVGRALAGLGTVSFGAPGFFSDGSLTPGPPGVEPASGLDAWVDRCLAEGDVDGHLTGSERRALREYAARATPALTALHGSRQLVHSDFNPKNLLVVREAGRWRVSAVLDWEFAFSGPQLTDVGNMLRDPRPPGFAEAFLAGFEEAGGDLPPDWRSLSQALDLYALADFLTRPPEHRYFARSVARIRRLLA
ncbi:phosphotransferase family protein [Actinoplanes regularis]|uniref:Predicted kinase, aminoglycoside phosphotransferase (APT) family n=1 Tax=Actinoplanes regularis TaxID=52697 RepID=A0A238Y913_9ACTN|nr:phosphotransferase [Actinoplanes regularis]GIE86134.1 hypothetical protein Are01nite_26140 [Actinoplanes regularis]SNR66829.1 Predicted kinase, aminoglycoside phosphotransferase (APT) family [Actinoplanes regularis]